MTVAGILVPYFLRQREVREYTPFCEMPGKLCEYQVSARIIFTGILTEASLKPSLSFLYSWGLREEGGGKFDE